MTPRRPRVTVTWLGHSTVVVDVGGVEGGDGVRFVTDPLLHRHAGVLRRRGDRPAEAWRGSAAVLLSHLHHDHAELRSLRLLGDVPILTAPANARWLRGRGLRGVGLGAGWHGLHGGPTTGRGDPRVSVRLVTAVHGHRPMPHRPNAANGHVVRVGSDGGAIVLWAVGDTEHYPDMVHLPRRAEGPVDVAFVPVAGWGPRLSGGHLDPAQAARVCGEVGVRTAIPVHWGTLHAPGGRNLPRGWMDHAGDAFRAAAAREAPETEVVLLRPGETWQGP